VDQLNKYFEILKSVNDSLKSFKFPTYYKVSLSTPDSLHSLISHNLESFDSY